MSQERKQRRPRAFDIASDPDAGTPKPAPEKTAPPRKPRTFDPGPALQLDTEDYFESDREIGEVKVAETLDRRRRLPFASVALAALGFFVSITIGLWIDSIVRTLFERNLWLGWASVGLAGVLAGAVLIIFLREIAAILRLRRIDDVRDDLEAALASEDNRALQQATERLIRHMATNPRSAAGREILDRQRGEIIDADDRYHLAETELFRVLDRQAFALVMAAAKRVSVVTAVSPRAFLDIAYVLFENFKLVRRLSELYGGRAGTLGNLRLIRKVLGHLAVTGAASFGDGLVQQVIGHGMASRLSARLGEGVLNGLMTARVGIAAMEVCRPAPFHAVDRPKLSSVLTTLTSSAEDVKVT